MIFTALKISANGDTIVSSSRDQERRGLLVFVKGGSEEAVDTLASKLSEATSQNVFILDKEAFGVKRHLPVADLEDRGYALGWRYNSQAGGYTHTQRTPSYYLLDANDHDRVSMDLSSSWGIRSLQYDTLLHVGNPLSPMLLYGNIRAVARGSDVFEFNKLAELALFLGNCEDPLAAMSMCNGCAQEVCYEHRGIEDLQERAYDFLEKDSRYLGPSKIDSLFTGKRIDVNGIREGLNWDNKEPLHETRSISAKKASAVRNFKKKNCSRCCAQYLDYGATCSKMRDCTKIYTEKDVRDLLKKYCKNRGMPLRANSYLGQANLRLTSRIVMARVDGLKKQWWCVAYCYKGKPVHNSRLSSVEQYLLDPPDTSNISKDILCVIYKPYGSYHGWGKLVRLRDLLRGLIAVKGWPITDRDCIADKARWIKGVPDDLMLLHSWMCSYSDSRKASPYKMKWRYYSLVGTAKTYTLPALNVRFKAEEGEWTSVKTVRPHIGVLEYRMSKYWSYDRYEYMFTRPYRWAFGYPIYDIKNFLYAGTPGMALQALENSCE